VVERHVGAVAGLGDRHARDAGEPGDDHVGLLGDGERGGEVKVLVADGQADDLGDVLRVDLRQRRDLRRGRERFLQLHFRE
jgi:hypothetical protein